MKKRGLDIRLLDNVIDMLRQGQTLDIKYRDHALTGNYEGYRECHIHPDLLLVYKKSVNNELLILTVYRISSHTNIFDISKSKKN